MPKYLFEASYVGEGIAGLLKEGGSSRRANIEKTVAGMGGKLEAFYYAFGDNDVYAIAELPDNESAAALALTIASTGAVKLRTVVLLTPEEADAATKKSVGYRAPGA